MFFGETRCCGILHAASASNGCAVCRLRCMKRAKTTVHAAGFDELSIPMLKLHPLSINSKKLPI